MQYRSEIDGLRAIAVLPVIFFHAGVDLLRGGYVGVDVFFVISGFLITSIILSEVKSDSFSLINFYERRARRILPALFFVMLVSIPFAWLWLLPSDMKDFAQSLIAVPTFSSNILFWQETGYWDVNNELKPMLHTWSLAVEEQFYVIFPIFLMLIWKLRKQWLFATLLCFTLISLFASHWGAYNKPTANFFILPTRVWELGIGSLISIFLLRVESFSPNRIASETLSTLGLLMIIYAVFMFDEKTPFPSLYALVPTLGAGLVILFASKTTLVGRLLSTKILVGLGLISYSIYLWHQPLLSFARHASFYPISPIWLSLIALLSIPLAYCSWRFIEKPFRAKGVFARKTIFISALVGSLLFILIGLLGVKTHGFELRAPQDHLTLKSIDDRWRINAGLSIHCTEEFNVTDDCKTSDKPEIVVWGDSYAMHLVKGLMASNPDAKIIQMTKYICGPFFDVSPIVKPDYPAAWAQECLVFNQKVHDWLSQNSSVKYAVLSSPFSQYLSKDSSILTKNGDQVLAQMELIKRQFVNTLEELRGLGIEPVIFSPPPANDINLGRCLTRAEWKNVELKACDFKREAMTDIRQKAFDFLESLSEKYKVIRLDNVMCDKSHCYTHSKSTHLYRDEGHLSHEGTEHLGKKLNFYQLIISEK